MNPLWSNIYRDCFSYQLVDLETVNIGEEVRSVGRVLKSKLTGSVDIDIDKNVDRLDISADLKKSVKEKLKSYVEKMNS